MKTIIINLAKERTYLTVNLTVYDSQGKKIEEIRGARIYNLEIHGVVKITASPIPSAISLVTEVKEGTVKRIVIDNKEKILIK